MGIKKCIYASDKFEELSKKYKLSWTEAARIGMAIMLSEKGVDIYDNELNERRKREFKESKIKSIAEKVEDEF